MSSPDPSAHYSPDPNIMEREAAGFLRRLCATRGEQRERRPAEVDALRSVQRRAIAAATVAGVLSGGAIGATEVFVRREWLDALEGEDWQDQLPVWAGFFAFAGLISLIEILFLYWSSLRAIARMSHIAGMQLGRDGYSEVIARGLARTALEFPNPRICIYGIDPHARMPGWRLTLRAVLHRMKVGVSSFVMRVLLRRVAGRMALRGLIPLVTGPLYAVWNAIITWRILREARLRALGPFAVGEIIDLLAPEGKGIPPPVGEVVLHGTGELMMRLCDAHPNYVLLLSRLVEEAGVREGSIAVDWHGKRRRLAGMGEREQTMALEALTLASFLGSRVVSSQKELLREAHGECGLEFRPQGLKQLRERLLEGRRIESGHLERVRG
jgi:hypothetical protein